MNRIQQQQQPAPVTGANKPTIGYTYDGRDQLSTVTDPRSLVTTYVNDGLGNQNQLISPDTGSTMLIYDLGGNVKTSKDARGFISAYRYDALNRVIGVSYTTSTGVTAGTGSTYEYDGGTAGAPNAKGHLTKMTDETGSTTYAYDGFGHLISKVQMVKATGRSFTVTGLYGTSSTATGKLYQLTYPSGNRIEQHYDSSGRISGIYVFPTASNGIGPGGAQLTLLSNIVYQPFGLPIAWSWGNSTSTNTNTYARGIDLDGRVNSYPLGNPLRNGLIRSLTYDAASRITAMNHSGTGTGAFAPANFNQGFGYDNLGRLITVTGLNNQSFSYDASGNRTLASFGTTSYTNTISPSSNRLNSTTGPSPAKTNQYDPAGNLTTDGSIGFTFNGRGRRSSATVAGGMVSYGYNGIGQRVLKSGPSSLVPTGAQQYVYDEAGHLLGEYDASGKMIQETVWLGDLPVAVLKQTVTGTGTAAVTSTQVYYVYADQINTPRVLTRASDNQMVWRWDATDPFGLQQPQENPAGLGVFNYNPRFPGQLYDRETNLHYNYFRDYDPQLGRYVESDPIGLLGGPNTYAYGELNPVSNVDPSGLQAIPMPMPFPAPGGGMSTPGGGRGGYDPRTDTYTPSPNFFPDWLRDLLNRPAEARASGEEKLPIVNPGRDCDGNCKPCPPGEKWFIPKPGHGHNNGYWHTIVYNQDKKTCMCYPDRPSGGLDGF